MKFGLQGDWAIDEYLLQTRKKKGLTVNFVKICARRTKVPDRRKNRQKKAQL